MISLILFDLDGTLVDVFKYHVNSYLDMFKAVYSIEIEENNLTKNFGLPQHDVIANPLREKNIDKKTIQKNLKKATECYFSNLETKILDGDEAILPGVIPLLTELSNEKYILGLITGNIPKVGKLILRKTGLDKFFSIKLFSDKTIKKREDLIDRAVNLAKEKYGLKDDRKIFIFGDSIHDLTAAKNTGCIGIGVATAYTKKEELEKESKYILEDLKHTKNVLNLIKNIQNL